METPNPINLFISEINKFEFEIPISIKLGFLIVLIIGISITVYVYRDTLNMPYINESYLWVYGLVIINLLNIFFVLLYYKNKTNTFKGDAGRAGRAGFKGKTGKYLTCSYCNTNLYIQNSVKYSQIARLRVYNDEPTEKIIENIKYFNSLIRENNIDYSIFIDSILRSSIRQSTNTAIRRFMELMTPDAMTFLIIYYISNQIGARETSGFGSIRRVYGKVGYLPLGDSIIGEREDFELNGFLVSGDIVYPENYKKLLSFKIERPQKSMDERYDIYTIWEPETTSISERNKMGKIVEKEYMCLGDICNYSAKVPQSNTVGLINRDCVEELDGTVLELMFIYHGMATNKNVDKTRVFDEAELEDADVEFRVATNQDIEPEKTLFSVWRTPLNTFITNIGIELMNGTVAYNILNGRNDVMDEYGGILLGAKQGLIRALNTIRVPKLMAAVYLIRNYEDKYYQEFKYYLDKYSKSIPELSVISLDGIETSGGLMKVIEQIRDNIRKFNLSLVVDKKIKKREFPRDFERQYLRGKKDLEEMISRIDKISSLYDLLMAIFSVSGLETIIAIDREGEEMGGEILTYTASQILQACKILFPPNRPVYIIKDECLGTFQMDSGKLKSSQELETMVREYKRKTELMQNEPEKYCGNRETWQRFLDYEKIIMTNIGSLIGHIDDWRGKLLRGQLDEITQVKLGEIIKEFKKLMNMLNSSCNNNKNEINNI